MTVTTMTSVKWKPMVCTAVAWRVGVVSDVYRIVVIAPNDDIGLPRLELVPVEPCEHGNYDRHISKPGGGLYPAEWCPGAGIGGNE